MKHHEHDRLRAWLVEDTGSEEEADRLLPVVERLRRLPHPTIDPAKRAIATRLLIREHRARQAEHRLHGRPQQSVVCIDDDPAMLDLIVLVLKNRGFEVSGATSGYAGLELIANVRPDLVLLDLMLPDLDGWDVYQRMKADKDMRTVPVIIVSAKAQKIDKELGLNIAKVQDYVTKPFSPTELVQSINKVLGQSDRASA